jgi:hypothetical protein
MKNYWLVITIYFSLTLNACKENPIDISIKDYIETNGSVKTDLNVKILSKENLGELKSVPDSLKPIVEIIFVLKKISSGEINEFDVTQYLNLIESGSLEDWEEISKKEKIIKNGIRITNGTRCFLWKYRYTINNPLLNNVKQEITKVFAISSNNEILGVINYDDSLKEILTK